MYMGIVEKMFYTPADYETVTLSRSEFVKIVSLIIGLSILTLLYQLYIVHSDFAVLSALWVSPFFVQASYLRLKDMNLKAIWLLLPLTGVGVFYFVYLLTKPGVDTEKTLTLYDSEGNPADCKVIDVLMFDNDKYIAVVFEEDDKEGSSVSIMRVQSSNTSFVAVEDSLSEQVFEAFKEKNKYKFEFV